VNCARSLAPLVAVALMPALAHAQAPAVPTALADYVKKPDASFAWKLTKTTNAPAGTVYELHLTSQTWHGIKWQHGMQVFVPKGCEPRPTMLLYNTGGRPGTTSALLGMAIAEKVGAPIAFLFGIPNQPLYGGKKEDALIAETFVRYLETGDPSWPLLFPMAKSLVRAMDALQAFSKSEWKSQVKGFVITGASKRGWTSWMTAASGDPRVKAIAPMVIDTLNMPVQMANQVKAFGKPSEMINDYVERHLVPFPDTPAAKKLWAMIDPWTYRARLTLPKMLIHGTNDPYWPQDALNSYWGDLTGDKYVLYVPNAGHDLRQTDAGGRREAIPLRAVNTLAAFARSQIFNQPMPKLTWKFEGDSKLSFESSEPIKQVRLWTAAAPTRDFRKSRWTQTEWNDARPINGRATFELPADGFRACFVECEYDFHGLPLRLSTQIRILEAKK
jgi:PhoPQ-activated pathogenicity-related protein